MVQQKLAFKSRIFSCSDRDCDIRKTMYENMKRLFARKFGISNPFVDRVSIHFLHSELVPSDDKIQNLASEWCITLLFFFQDDQFF